VSAQQPAARAKKVEKQAAPAADDACVLCGYWRCRCGGNGFVALVWGGKVVTA